MVISGNLCSFRKEVKALVLYDVEHGIAMEPMKGKWASSRVDLGTLSYFAFLRWHQCSSCFVTVFLVTLWCSFKQIESPFMFDWEHGIALHAIQGNRASTPGEGDVSWDFSNVAGTWGILSSYSGDGHSKLHFVQRSQNSCIVMMETSGI